MRENVTSPCLEENTTRKEVIDLNKIVYSRSKLEVDEYPNLSKNKMAIVKMEKRKIVWKIFW